ncbi:MAG: hypothetical protein ACOYLF_14190 [Blastocatellia bacterium]
MTIEVEFVDAQTGKLTSKKMQEPSMSFFEVIKSEQWTDRQIESFIDRLDISADAKANLASFAKVTVKVGREVLRIGRKILDVLFSFLRSFPGIGFGVIFAVVISTLLSAIPLVGAVLGPIASTLIIAFGGYVDLKNPAFSERLDAFVEELRPLAA